MNSSVAYGAGNAAALLLLIVLGGCTSFSLPGFGDSKPAASAPTVAAAPPATAAPPLDLAGTWQLTAAAGGACIVTLGDSTTAGTVPADRGTLAPQGGCPGNFFTARNWTFENGALVIRDFKGRPLAQLSYTGNQFEGQDARLGALILSKQG
jgi:Protease inhibitor Inh